jgi:hypothetical protein
MNVARIAIATLAIANAPQVFAQSGPRQPTVIYNPVRHDFMAVYNEYTTGTPRSS